MRIPQRSRTVATAEAGRVLSQPAADGPLEESEPPPEEAVEVKATMPKVLPTRNSRTPGDELGDAAIGEGERDNDGNGFVGEQAGVDGGEGAGGEAEAGEAKRGGLRGFRRCRDRVSTSCAIAWGRSWKQMRCAGVRDAPTGAAGGWGASREAAFRGLRGEWMAWFQSSRWRCG